jgi:hypothetical protein
LQEQIPSAILKLFDGFSGYVESLKFSKKLFEIPINENEIRASECLFDLKLSIDGLDPETGSIINRGSEGELIRFSRIETLKEIMLFEMYPVQPFGIDGLSQEPTETVQFKRQFDGLACADNHRTLELTSYDSSLSFDTIVFD